MYVYIYVHCFYALIRRDVSCNILVAVRLDCPPVRQNISEVCFGTAYTKPHILCGQPCMSPPCSQ